MALSSDARTLKVPPAGMLAKNMKALKSSSGLKSVPAASSSAQHENAANYFMGLGAHIETSQLNRNANSIRFRKAPDDSQPNPIVAMISKLINRSKDGSKANQKNNEEKPVPNKTIQKMLPILEKASAIISRFPDPTMLYLSLVLTILLINRFRPHLLHSIIVKIALIVSFFPIFIIAFLWRKSDLFVMIREGQSLLSHPAEHQMDGVEAALSRREEEIKAAQETLKKNRNQLDALRKELAKDPNAHDPEAIILPSQKAAEMIRDGALGAGYDEEAAHAVEQRRREESVKRGREEWKAKTEEADNNLAQTQQNVKKLEAHAATAYTKRTREIKTKTSIGPGKGIDRIANVKKAMSFGSKREEEENRRNSAQSERSNTFSTNNSGGSKRRLRFFGGRKPRESERTMDGNPPPIEAEPSESREIEEQNM